MASKRKTPGAAAAPKAKKPKAKVEGGPARELNENELQTLAFPWKAKYEASLNLKKKGDADFKNVCKRIHAELGPDGVLLIKDMITLETEEGEHAHIAKIERMLRAARWMNVEVGSQAELFPRSGEPATERAFNEGVKARLEGKPAKSPYHPTQPQNDKWLEGHAEGGRRLIAADKRDDELAFGKGKVDPGESLADAEEDETTGYVPAADDADDDEGDTARAVHH